MNERFREVNASAFVLGLLFCGEWSSSQLSQLLSADDTSLEVDSEGKSCRLVSDFSRAFERRELRVITGKCNVEMESCLVT